MDGEIYEATILRIPRREGVAPFDQRPRIEDFLPSTEDKKRATTTGGPVLLSVFDRAKTSIPQALVIRGIQATEGFAILPLEAQDIRTVTIPDGRKLFVIQDPLPEPKCRLEGAEGHCGIGDLTRRPGQPKAIIRDICSRLVDISRVMR